MRDDGWRGVAYHEAGHAVVALALGLHVAGVEIFAEDNSGRAEVAPSGHLTLVDRLAICLAGINANEMFDAEMHELAGFQDHVMVMKLVSSIPEAEGDVLREQGHQRAWDLLKANAESVHDIARQLLADRKIDLTGYVMKQ